MLGSVEYPMLEWKQGMEEQAPMNPRLAAAMLVLAVVAIVVDALSRLR